MSRPHRVAYPRATWSRGDAWDNLRKQQIPGCPDVKWFEEDERRVVIDQRWGHRWLRDHSATEWAWVYVR